MRTLVLVSLVACSSPRNLVCERIAIKNAESPASRHATCEPELTDRGPQHVHRARVTQQGATVVCALIDASISMECGPLLRPPGPQRPGGGLLGPEDEAALKKATQNIPGSAP